MDLKEVFDDIFSTPKMSFKEYHAIDRLSSHRLIDFKKSPLLYFKKHISKELIDEPSKQMGLGRVFHTKALEPDIKLFIEPEVDKRTKDGKEAIKRFYDELGPDVEVCSKSDNDTASLMCDALRLHADANDLMSGIGENEKTILFDVEYDNHVFNCKMRPDRIKGNKDSCVLIDLKSAFDVSPVKFGLSAENFCYDIQMAFYYHGLISQGYKVDKIVLIAVQNCEPFDVACYEIIPPQIEKCTEEIMRLLTKMHNYKYKQDFIKKGIEPLWTRPYYYEGSDE